MNDTCPVEGEATLPVNDGFMDADMLSFWHNLHGPLQGDLRLYGGTALALYLNHRQSTDFGFATPLPVVDQGFARSLNWLKRGDMTGGPGMVDVRLQGKRRQLLITLMETGALVPVPVRDPVPAPNGVAVAHPLDLVVAKSTACLSRNAARDYFDLASAISAWPQLCRDAIKSVEAHPVCRLAACIGDPPPAATEALGVARAKILQDFAAATLEQMDPESGSDMDGPT